MRYALIKKFDIANAPFVCTTLFVSGCTHNCFECFNKEVQNFNYGQEWTDEVEFEFIEASKNKNIKGICLLGGEPLQQDGSFLKLLKRLNKEVKKPIWCWTGYTLEELLKTDKKELLNYIDVLIDGRFEISKRDLNLKYKGSSNQRVLDLKRCLKEDKIILYNEGEK